MNFAVKEKLLFAACIFMILCNVPFLTSVANSSPDIADVNFSAAQIVVPGNLTTSEQAALQMLKEEIEARSLITITHASKWPSSSTPVVVVGTKENLKDHYGPFSQSKIENTVSSSPEGFTVKLLQNTREAPTVFIIGNDSRGMLFGIGYLLRKASMDQEELILPSNISTTTHPSMPLRGHQAAYRPKTNSYDGFTIEMWEQYIRDLIVFGTNSIELLPPHTDDADDSPMFPRPQMDMMVKMNDILAKYNLNAWIWYPLMYGDYSKPENVQKSLKENKMVFSKLTKIDAIFVPGGDPGHQHPKTLFSYLSKEAKILHKYHPDAEIWVSPQGFDSNELEDFYTLLEEKPKWLTGIVYGPWVRQDVDKLRKIIPASYPIRRYPDITHNLDSQYPVPNWDYAYAATEHRESINPRPTQQKTIFNTFESSKYKGFITYSEGVNDDVNKIIWSGLGWNPEADVTDILRDYSRYFIGPEYASSFAQGLMDLEKNWESPLLGNSSVYTTHYKFQSMEEEASPKVKLNWRFQMGLFRSYYDAYTRSRLLYETQLENDATSVLRKASEVGSLTAMEKAESILEKAKLNYPAEDWRVKLFQLAEALFQSIHMQKTVDEYFAISIGRGANLDLINYPLNNRVWLDEQFKRIRQIENEEKRLDELKKITEWENPGPGGFYDDLGNLGNQPHLVKGESYSMDPAFLKSPFVGFSSNKNWRVSWARYMQTLYEQPLEMQYLDLDINTQYEVKVTYTGNNFYPKIRLLTDGGLEVHSYIKKPRPIKPVTFEIPREATDDGKLTLKWNIETGTGGAGRGCQVAEVWLMKKR